MYPGLNGPLLAGKMSKIKRNDVTIVVAEAERRLNGDGTSASTTVTLPANVRP